MGDFTRLIANKEAVEIASRIPDDIQKKLLSYVTEATISGSREFDVNRVERCSELLKLKIESVLDLVGLYASIVRVFMQTNDKEFCETMSAVGFSKQFIEKFPLQHKPNLSVSLILSGRRGGIQKLASFKWRVDISFVCGVLDVPIPPKIIISLRLKNGQKYAFELDLKAFHRLRFNIALAFKQFHGLNNSNAPKYMMLL